jgi:hypothetical protein
MFVLPTQPNELSAILVSKTKSPPKGGFFISGENQNYKNIVEL